MRMNRERDILKTCTHFNCECGFTNQVARFGADDVNSQNKICIGIGDDFYEAIGLHHRNRQ